jgi:hypothetical protein
MTTTATIVKELIMSTQSTLPAFPSYPARMDYKDDLQQLPGIERRVVMEELPNIEGWIYTAQGFPVPALCAPFPQFDSSAECYSAEQILSKARHYIAAGSSYHICTAISRATMPGGRRISDTLRDYLGDCLVGGSAGVDSYSSFISTVLLCFEPYFIFSAAERTSIYRNGRIFWIDWMLHQVAQQLTNFAGEQA